MSNLNSANGVYSSRASCVPNALLGALIYFLAFKNGIFMATEFSTRLRTNTRSNSQPGKRSSHTLIGFQLYENSFSP